MPTINKLQSLAKQVLSGQQELNLETARELIASASADGRIYKDEELKLLEQVEAQAPAGSAYGRELLKTFIDGGHQRIRSAKNASETSPMANMWSFWSNFNPYLPKYSVPEPRYGSTEAGKPGGYTRTLPVQSEQIAKEKVVGETALRELVQKYDGASRDVGLTTTRIIINDDVYKVYLKQVKDKPINENDPMGAVQKYLDSHYNRIS